MTLSPTRTNDSTPLAICAPDCSIPSRYASESISIDRDITSTDDEADVTCGALSPSIRRLPPTTEVTRSAVTTVWRTIDEIECPGISSNGDGE